MPVILQPSPKLLNSLDSDVEKLEQLVAGVTEKDEREQEQELAIKKSSEFQGTHPIAVTNQREPVGHYGDSPLTGNSCGQGWFPK